MKYFKTYEAYRYGVNGVGSLRNSLAALKRQNINGRYVDPEILAKAIRNEYEAITGEKYEDEVQMSMDNTIADIIGHYKLDGPDFMAAWDKVVKESVEFIDENKFDIALNKMDEWLPEDPDAMERYLEILNQEGPKDMEKFFIEYGDEDRLQSYGLKRRDMKKLANMAFESQSVTEAKDNLYLQLHKKYAEQIKGLKAKKIKKLTDLVSVQRWAMEDVHGTPGHDHKAMSRQFNDERKLFKKYIGGDESVMLPKGTEALAESSVTEAKKYSVHYSDGMRAGKEFKSEREAMQYAQDLIKNKKGLQFVSVHKPGMSQTAHKEDLLGWWGDGSYWGNVSKKDKDVAKMKIGESILNEGMMSELDLMAKEAKSFSEFLKDVFSTPEYIKHKGKRDVEKFLKDFYFSANESVTEGKSSKEKFKEESDFYQEMINDPKKRVYDIVDFAQFTTGGMTEKQWEMFMYGRYKKNLQSKDSKIKEKMYKVLTKWLGESVNEASRLSFRDAGIIDLVDLQKAIESFKAKDISWNQKGQAFMFSTTQDLKKAKEVLDINENELNEKKVPVNRETIEFHINSYRVDDDPYDVAIEIGNHYKWTQKEIEKAEKLIRKYYLR